jgi:hypothetical protein
VGFRVVRGIVELPVTDPYLRSFLVPTDRGQCRVNVWRSDKRPGLFTVGTALSHPRKGRTQMFRRDCTEKEVRELLQNPRKHTGKGYRKK